MPFVTLQDQKDALAQEYDFIVVGAGSAGCPLASRLSEDRSVTVLLIEAGPRYHSAEDTINVTVPAAAGKLQHSKTLSWEYYTTPQAPNCCTKLQTFEGADPAKKHRSFWPRGKGLGGSSLLNYMAWVRGHPNDYEEWETKFGCQGWGWSSIKPLFEERIENISDCDSKRLSPERRSSRGPYGISHKKPTCSLASQFLDACKELGFGTGDYNSGFDATKGMAGLHQQSVRKGTRCNSARVYIEPLLQNDSQRPNLTVLTGAQCHKIVTETKDGKLVATGVELIPDEESDDSTNKVQIACGKEVILSAGAIGSPQILLQSGIGPGGATLDSPQVGQHLLDHLFCVVRFAPKLGQGNQDIGSINGYKAEGWKTALANMWDCFIHHKGILTSPAYDASLFFNSKPVEGVKDVRPNLQISCMCSALDSPFIHGNIGMDTDDFEMDEAHYADYAEGLIFCAILLIPKSKGSVTLDAKNNLVIDAGYLTDEKDEDLKQLVDCVKKSIQIANTKPYQTVVKGSPYWPKDLCRKFNVTPHDGGDDKFLKPEDYPDAFLEEYIRRYSTTLYHPTSTCRMGTSPKESVVDPSCKVYGIGNLRVADASIQPSIVSGNTQASCVVIGEKAADILQKEYSLKTDPQDLLDAVEVYEAEVQRKRRVVAGGLLATAAAVVVGASMVVARGGLRSMT